MRRPLPPKLEQRKSSLVSTASDRGKVGFRPTQGQHTRVGFDLKTDDIFHLSPKHRQNHTHVLGTTGTGKSKFMEHMLRQDIGNRNCGVCLIDPHGKLYKDALSYVATEKSTLADRLVLFDPFNDLENCIGFNPLPIDKQRFDYIENNFVASCLKAWGQDDPHETPRISLWLKHIAHTLLMNNMTLLESAVLTVSSRDDPERRRLVNNVVNYTVQSAWNDFFNGADSKRKEMIEGAGNRLQSFLQNEVIRLIIGQQNNVLDFSKIMAEGKIVLINLNDEHQRVTQNDASFLGTMIVSELFRATKLRDYADPRLKPFYVYIDEFAQYVTHDVARALEEARKFKCFYTLAHQHLAQLKKEDAFLYSSVIGNCKNKVVFGGLSNEDLDIMAGEIHTGFLDLKNAKHEQMRIRNRMIETTRKVVQASRSHSTGQSDQRSFSQTESGSVAEGQSASETHSATKGRSFQQGTSQTTSHSNMVGVSDTTSQSDSVTNMRGTNSSETNSKGGSESESQGLNFGRSDGHTDGKNASNSYTRSTGGARSHTDGKSASLTEGQASTSTEGNSESNSSGFARTETDGRQNSSGRSQTMRRDEFEYASQVHSDNSGRSSSSGITDNESSTSAYNSSQSLQDSRSQTKGRNSSDTNSENWSEAYGNSSGTSESDTHTQSSGENFSKSKASNFARGETVGVSASLSDGSTQSKGHTDNRSATDTTAHGASKTEGTSNSESIARGKTQSVTNTKGNAKTEGTAHTESSSETLSQGESWVPFHEIEEVEEVASIQFWSLNDLMYLKKAEMKTQNTGEAFIKIENLPPVHCQIEHVQERQMSQRLKADILKKFKKRVAARNPGQYLPLREARSQMKQRQIEAFGEPINFYDTLIDPNEEQEPQTSVTVVDDKDDPFTRR